jgi:dTDP-L-rhamnose 4-epimerase
MSKLLIIGGGGLIGQEIASRHIAGGDEVYIYDKELNPYNNYNKLKGIILSKDLSIEMVTKYEKFDIISNQAAYVGVGESQYNFHKYTQNNIGFTSELLQSLINMRQNTPSKLILAGSMGPYGEGPYYCEQHQIIYPSRTSIEQPTCEYCNNRVNSIPISEEMKRMPKSVYGITKMAQEDLYRVFSSVYKIPSVSLRYFSVYGLESNPNNPYTGVLSVIANKIINSPSVNLYEDGSQTRDLISAKDVAEAHWHTCHEMKSVNLFEEFNIGTGISVSMNYVASKMLKILSPDKSIIFTGEYRNGDIKHSQASIKKILRCTKWTPKQNIDSAINLYCDYIINNWGEFSSKGDTSFEEHKRLIQRGVI